MCHFHINQNQGLVEKLIKPCSPIDFNIFFTGIEQRETLLLMPDETREEANATKTRMT